MFGILEGTELNQSFFESIPLRSGELKRAFSEVEEVVGQEEGLILVCGLGGTLRAGLDQSIITPSRSPLHPVYVQSDRLQISDRGARADLQRLQGSQGAAARSEGVGRRRKVSSSLRKEQSNRGSDRRDMLMMVEE